MTSGIERVVEIEGRYRAAFPNDPVPHKYWHRSYAELLDLMEAAIKDGVPLTPESLIKAQGVVMSPPDAEV